MAARPLVPRRELMCLLGESLAVGVMMFVGSPIVFSIPRVMP
jgi:hypothetical protein